MGKGEDFNLLKIQTHILKVNIHCDGCKLKVKKLLHRIDGVYSVSIDVDQQKVTVSGSVNSETLIQKLIRAGKRAELWSQKINQINYKPTQQKQQQIKQVVNPKKPISNKNTKEQAKQGGLMRGLQTFKHQHNKLSSSSSDEDDFEDDEDDDEGFEDLRFIDSKMKQINLMRRTNDAAPSAKKSGNGNVNVCANASNRNKGHMKTPNGSQQKGINIVAGNNKMATVSSTIAGAEGRRMMQGSNGMMAGLGHVLGGNTGVLPGNAFNGGGQYQPPMMSHPSTMVNSLRGNNMVMHESNRYMQPQMMHLRSPQISPYTGYYNSYPSPYYLSNQIDNGYYGTHLFSDENTNACSIM
ncbi:heavy metal-associated isoprenylated plant protein 3-like [Canna indica]|uniref:Heavy metal-associated isoprenylated plant protein 3-like n=1 Tax=Canna indica TaxID=4628 RepID=A0AAQ3JWL5_9LILI|nr:heavy metal-associated isoprenylated plant protein 3-like [Canna indica]